jgi:hypothetical protein
MPFPARIVAMNRPDFLPPAEETSLSPRERAGVRGNSAFESPLASAQPRVHGKEAVSTQ